MSCLMVLAPLAGGLGWGIRGQYGHETGAMIPGLLVGLVLVLLVRPQASTLQALRAVALCAAAMGFGGAMTYGQTIGLTQNPEVVGDWAAFAWGMMGLGVKGALWIGFAGLFLGMGLGGIKYRSLELALLSVGMMLLFLLGRWVLNSPFDPGDRVLPGIYFSADWHFYPDAGLELKPRHEHWGGFLFALAGLWFYVSLVRKDRLARNLAIWGCLGGLGFPLGQSLQAWHEWNARLFAQSPWVEWSRLVNWWNMMEIVFGCVLAAALAAGLWFNRRRIAPLVEPCEITIPPLVEFLLLAMHLALLYVWEFLSMESLDALGDLGFPRSVIPLICIVGGRYWPGLMAGPVIAMTILGRTAKSLGFDPANSWLGVVAFMVLPVLLLTWLVIHLQRQPDWNLPGSAQTKLGPWLLLAAWSYFILSCVCARFPWPGTDWTAHTGSVVIYVSCLAGLTWCALRAWRVTPGDLAQTDIRRVV